MHIYRVAFIKLNKQTNLEWKLNYILIFGIWSSLEEIDCKNYDDNSAGIIDYLNWRRHLNVLQKLD